MNEHSERSFSEIEIGDELGPVTRTPTTEMVRRYAQAVDIKELRFFFDPEEARKNGLEQPIVPGPLTAGFMAQLLKDTFCRLAAPVDEHTPSAPLPCTANR